MEQPIKVQTDEVKKLLAGVQKVNQGKVVAEAQEKGWLVSFPDGEISFFSTQAKVLRAAQKFFKDNLGSGRKMGIGILEWRS